MQVKKFEAPTIQEALEVIKQELGPEAIILQTKKMKKGFGLMSRDSVEVTAAVSERAIHKKGFAEKRLRPSDKEALKALPAEKQGDIYDKYIDTSAKMARYRPGATSKKLTATRYAEIDAEPAPREAPQDAKPAARAVAAALAAEARAQAQSRVQQAAAGAASAAHQAQTLEDIAQGRISSESAGAVVGKLGAGMSVEEELRHLKRMIEEMKVVQDDLGAGAQSAAQGVKSQSGLETPALQDAFEQLVLSGMDRRLAFPLVKRAAFELGEDRAQNPEYVLDQLAVEIMQGMQVVSPFKGIGPKVTGEGPTVIALVGPTGVGKTTTVAKLASEALLKRNLKVGLINLDSYKVAAFDQLGTYAKILNTPFRSAGTAEELRTAIGEFRGLDVVLIDTTGRSQRDPSSLKEMQDILGSVPNIKTHLVLAVTTRDNELYDMANRFGAFKPEGLIVSKLDEATIYGAIYNVALKAKLPLSYFTTGQRVPEDIEEASQERVAALVMDL